MEVPIIWRNSEREEGIISITHYSVICTSTNGKGRSPQVHAHLKHPRNGQQQEPRQKAVVLEMNIWTDVKEDEHTRFIMNCAMKRYSICGCFLNE